MAQKIFDCFMYAYFFFSIRPMLEYLYFNKKKTEILEEGYDNLKISYETMSKIAGDSLERVKTLSETMNRFMGPIEEALKEGKTVFFTVKNSPVQVTGKKDDRAN